MKTLIYTFRTFLHIEELKQIFPEVIVFGRLKEDLDNFCKQIMKEKPDMILGIALSNDSVFEPKAINHFNGNLKIIKDGKEELSLFVPNLQNQDFKVSAKPTDSFCNYSMYKIKHFLEENNLDIPFAFTHIKKEDIKKLIDTLG